ncbi:MAG TPA: carboxylating nicotinate-nucleotide diphosphorylase [Candidatus Atribacteria bacterium]|nr:MAG: carboxylating nicotinate-nucleotide diphosphorylase [Candidatus Omnitrophota bacterium]HDK25565.1 carboxylating nicotinate-nucleotide diphosphorylase [Candidatus Atribacteria bacterium]
MYLSKPILQRYLLRFLEVDLGLGDITTSVLISSQTKASAKIVLKEAKPVFLAGLEEVICLLEALEIKTKSAYQDGVWAKPHVELILLEGKARDILVAERTVLNILMRMTAIATMTKNIQDRIKAIGSRSKVAATRKTLPGFIYFDKKAVAIGGGDTHRFHLEDAILIKNNHLILVGSIAEALKQARRTSFSKKIEIEVSNLEEALIAATLGADIIMLDNFPPKMVGETINALTQKGLREKVLIEVSGRITPETVLDYAIYNPDIISCGALTHSVRAIDVSLKIEK